MNNWIIPFTVDLQHGSPLVRNAAQGLMLPSDRQAHTIRVTVFNGKNAASLSGAAMGYFCRGDGQTVVCTGSISGNVVTVTMAAACYAVAGPLRCVIRVQEAGSNGVGLSLVEAQFYVREATGDSVIDPGSVIPSLEDLLAELDAMREATAAAEEVLEEAEGFAEAKRIALYDKEIITQYVADSIFSVSNAKDEVVHAGAYDGTKNGWLIDAADFAKLQSGQPYKFQSYAASRALEISRVYILYYDSLGEEAGTNQIFPVEAENVTLVRNMQYSSDIFYVAVPDGAASAVVRMLDQSGDHLTESDFIASGAWVGRQRFLPVYGLAVRANQGVLNAGKALVVGDDGMVTLASGGGEISYERCVEKGQVDYSPTYSNNPVSSSTGQQGSANTSYASTPPLYYLPEYCELLVSFDAAVYQTTVYCFDEDQAYVGYVPTASVVSGAVMPLPDGTRYMRFYVVRLDRAALPPATAKEAVTYTCRYAGKVRELEAATELVQDSLDKIVVNNNLLIGVEPVDGYYKAKPITTESAARDYSFFPAIPVTSGVTYRATPAARFIYIMSGTGASPTTVNFVENGTEITAAGDGYAYISYAKANVASATFSEADKEDVYPRDSFALSDAVIFPDTLSGKKWAVLGDSFTAGVTASGTIDGGMYSGQKAVYPYLIGNRTKMNIVSFFLNGRTLAFPANPDTFANSVTNPNADCYYQNIPADADYITIYLGINDSHHAPGSSGGDGEDNTGVIPLGSITDTTTESFYGAWNVVLPWIIQNRPNAHLGIIVSNGCDSDAYRLATIEVAKKHGVPYIDLNGDERTPAMIRSTNPNVADSVKLLLRLKWAISASNTHPNDAAHQFESTFIEAFLRSI